jgi:hypothetical protein
MSSKYCVQVDGAETPVSTYKTERAAIAAAEAYNAAAEPESPLAYAYAWDADNEEWSLV